MIRLSVGGIFVASFLVLAGAGPILAGAGPTPAVAGRDGDLRALPMQFEWRREGPSEACGATCKIWISAVGAITPDTPRTFEAFAASHDVRGATVAFDSGGGSVLAALALGRSIRRFDMTTTIGKTIELPITAGEDPRSKLSPQADCESMCAFLLLAGTRRYVPPEAEVLVHQIWLGDKRNDATAASYTAEDIVTVQRDIGRLALYTAEMGGGMELLERALRVPPWEQMRALSRDDLRRMKLQTLDKLQDQKPPDVTSSAAPSDPGLDNVSAINLRGWAVLEKAGQIMLARRHPLTSEGEEIGNFDIMFGCAPVGDSFMVTYVERRRNPVSQRLPEPLKDVSIVLGRNSVPLKIVSSRVAAIAKPPELTSSARGIVPIALMKSFADVGTRSLTVETASRDNAETAIRIGNTGVAQYLPKLTAACAK